MIMNRRQFSKTSLAAAAVTAMPGLARAEAPKTIALMFDAFDSDFWITGNSILKAKAKENGWNTLETISNRDQNKQNDQVKAMVERKVDGIIFIPTDNNAAITAIRTANNANVPIILLGLLEIEWAILGGQSGENAGGHGLLRAWSSAEIRHHERCRNQARDSVVCRTGIRSRAFGLARAFVAYSVIQMCGSSRSIGAQKNDLQLLRSRPDGLVRLPATAGSRSVERRVPDRSGVGGAAHRVRRLRLREARAAGVSGGQSPLYQAVCLLCRASLPAGRDPRCRQGTEARLGNSQDARDAVHAGADRTGGRAGTQGDRHRRDLDSQGPRLSHRGQRSGAQEADLVRRRRPFRGEHGAVLRLAGATEVRQNQARRDGHVETVPQRREGKGAASRDPVRQVPHHAPSRRGARQGAQGRIRPPRRQGSALHQRPEVHAAVASREPHPGGQALAPTPGGRQQASQYRLRPEGGLRPTMGLYRSAAKVGIF